MVLEHISNPFNFPEAKRLMTENPDPPKVRVEPKSALFCVAFEPGLCAEAA